MTVWSLNIGGIKSDLFSVLKSAKADFHGVSDLRKLSGIELVWNVSGRFQVRFSPSGIIREFTLERFESDMV